MKELLKMFKEEINISQGYLDEWEKEGVRPCDDSTPEYEQGYLTALQWVVDKLEKIGA